MDRDKLRSILDAMEEDELIELRDAVEKTPDGSTQEVMGVSAKKEEALMLINQAMVMDTS
ncbi:MAG TPA: hypothetical protein VM324_01660 [Egibacteraceae bacterium]|nr:hypothetical protein [Egibacteraceae bacterium]